jgi:hypothetical protein
MGMAVSVNGRQMFPDPPKSVLEIVAKQNAS